MKLWRLLCIATVAFAASSESEEDNADDMDVAPIVKNGFLFINGSSLVQFAEKHFFRLNVIFKGDATFTRVESKIEDNSNPITKQLTECRLHLEAASMATEHAGKYSFVIPDIRDEDIRTDIAEFLNCQKDEECLSFEVDFGKASAKEDADDMFKAYTKKVALTPNLGATCKNFITEFFTKFYKGKTIDEEHADWFVNPDDVPESEDDVAESDASQDENL